MISLTKAFRLGPTPQVAFVGAGGKTSAIFALAREYKTALVTTSTHLSVAQAHSGDAHIEIKSVADIEGLDPGRLAGVQVLSGPPSGERVAGLSSDQLAALSAHARRYGIPLLIEADGARELSLKAPTDHEPAIPPFVDAVVVVAGLSALGKPLEQAVVHRAELFADLSGLAGGAHIHGDAIARMLVHSQGGLKGIPANARKLVLLNQADTPEFASAAKTLADSLLPVFDAVIVSVLKQAPAASAVYERTAGILLAAGGSQRLGSAKQLLDWKGKPFVRQVAATALASGLDPLIVVTGFNAEAVETAVINLEVQLVRNADWQAGQSSSVKAGLAALPQSVGGALFLVVDQPQLPIALIEALLAEHTATLAPIVAPLVDGQRSNPVLFDRATFADFAALEGDVGGRAIFAKHQVTWLPWLDASLSIDVDFPEDYDRLLRQAG